MPESFPPASWPVPLPTRALSGRLVRLEPLKPEHGAKLLLAGQHDDVWTYTTSDARTPDAMARYVDGLRREYTAGTALPFVVRWRTTGGIVGATRLKRLSRANRSAMIGSWYSPAVWGTGVNVEAKLLLLTHAFERLGCLRVEFHTDALNARSRVALARLGAVEEGVLRSAQLTREGRRRDTVVFSVLDTEWAQVRQGLESRLLRRS